MLHAASRCETYIIIEWESVINAASGYGRLAKDLGMHEQGAGHVGASGASLSSVSSLKRRRRRNRRSRRWYLALPRSPFV